MHVEGATWVTPTLYSLFAVEHWVIEAARKRAAKKKKVEAVEA